MELNRLCQAVLDGDAELAREYCELGDDVNEATGPCRRAPLHLACRNNDLDLATYLLEVAGARADLVSGDGLQALHIAVSHRNRRMVELLLRQDLELSPPVKFMGRTALFMAVEYGCYGIAEALLNHGARIDESQAGSCSLMNLALRKGKKWLALLTSYDCGPGTLDLVDKYELKTPLIQSIEEQDAVLVARLLAKGASADLEAYSVEGYMSPLNLAAHLGNEEVTRLLLRHGARVGINEALRHASMHGKPGLVELLLSSPSADPHSCNLDGCTALHLAVINEQSDTVRALLRHDRRRGQDSPVSVVSSSAASLSSGRSNNFQVNQINLGSTSRIPVLYCAVKTGRCDIIEMLIEHGYPVNEYVCQRVTLLDYAIKTRAAAVIDLLMCHGAVFSSCSHVEKAFAVKNLALLMAQGRVELGKSHLRRINGQPKLGRLFERCLRELEAMKMQCVGEDTKTTFYELLTTNDDETLLDLVKGCVDGFPGVEECRERFPQYCDALIGNYERARSREQLMDQAGEGFDSAVLMHRLPPLTAESVADDEAKSTTTSTTTSSSCAKITDAKSRTNVVWEIMRRLGDEDLRRLLEALRPAAPPQDTKPDAKKIAEDEEHQERIDKGDLSTAPNA